MEKLYKLKSEVFKYIHKTQGLEDMLLPLKEWLDKGYTSDALDVCYFELGYMENDNTRQLCGWHNNVSTFYFTLRISQNLKEHQSLNNNSEFKTTLIKEINLAFERVYNDFNINK